MDTIEKNVRPKRSIWNPTLLRSRPWAHAKISLDDEAFRLEKEFVETAKPKTPKCWTYACGPLQGKGINAFIIDDGFLINDIVSVMNETWRGLFSDSCDSLMGHESSYTPRMAASLILMARYAQITSLGIHSGQLRGATCGRWMTRTHCLVPNSRYTI